MSEIKRIMVLTRTTKHCQKAVHYGVQLARKFEAELYVMNSIHNPFGEECLLSSLSSASNLKDEYKSLQEEAKKDIDEMIDKETSTGLPIEVIVNEDEIPKKVIEFITTKNIDILVIRAHQEGRFEHYWFGRNNETFLRKLPCSILMVKDEPKAVNY